MIFGQGKKFDPEKTYYDAEFLVLYKKYKEALPLYLQVQELGYGNSNIDFNIGKTYLQIPGQKYKALPYLEKAVENITRRYRKENSYNEHKAPEEALMYLGQAYQITNQLKKAVEYYQLYRKKLEAKNKSTKEPDRLIESCKFAKLYQNDPKDVDMHPIDLSISDSIPIRTVFSGDGNTMIFMSDRKYYQSINFTKKILGQWIPPINITMELESDGNFEISSLSSDGTTLLLSYFNSHDKDIYMSNFRNGRWEKAKKLNRNINSLQDEVFASISPDKKTLFFASNRRGGLGGLDLYQSPKLPDGSWGPVENMGPVLNTEYDENSPCLLEKGQFYFSSAGHKTMGGYDVFVSKRKADSWSPPINLGSPLNTTDDNYYYRPVKNGIEGYITRFATSNDKPTAVFQFDFYNKLNPRKSLVNGRVYFNGPPPEETSISLVVRNNTGDPLISDTLNTQKGNFSFALSPGDYILLVNGSGIEPYESRFQILPGNKSTSLELNLLSKTKEKSKPVFSIPVVYFGFDQFKLKENVPEKFIKLVEALRDYPETKVVITGHTDDIGSSNYNLKLSVRRAGSVLSYLKEAGIEPTRLTIKGKGENEPIAKNKRSDQSDDPAGRKFNRRVCFSFTGPGSEFVTQETPIIPLNQQVNKK